MMITGLISVDSETAIEFWEKSSLEIATVGAMSLKQKCTVFSKLSRRTKASEIYRKECSYTAVTKWIYLMHVI